VYKYYKLALSTMESFIYYSKKIGKDFLLCQGPGGNTSIKKGKDIYIKKSGELLNKTNKETFKKVDFKKISNFYLDAKDDQKFEKSLSIETPFHVLLNKKYVFHYHSLASIIISAIYSKSEMKDIFVKNDILSIPYLRPGYELAKRMVKLNNVKNSNIFFLYNHGVVIKGNNISQIYSEIRKTENLFANHIDYKKLKAITNKILKLKIHNNKIKNPNSNLDYTVFNQKYLFPDHSVFFPNKFEERNKENNKDAILFDPNYLYLNKKLNLTEETYFKALLILFNVIGNNKIKNYIKEEYGEQLRNSEDEQLRIRLNK